MELIKQNLNASVALGFKIRVMVCDRGFTNESGIPDLHITDERFYVIVKNGQKVYFLLTCVILSRVFGKISFKKITLSTVK